MDEIDVVFQDEKATKLVVINASATEYMLEFETSAPYTNEENYSTDEIFNKTVTVVHDSTLHYTNIKSYSAVPEDLIQEGIEFSLYWNINGTIIDVTNDERFQVEFIDTDSNGIVDQMQWIVPQLSKQKFQIIAIKNDSKLIDRIEIYTSCSKPIDIGEIHNGKIVSLEITNVNKIFDEKDDDDDYDEKKKLKNLIKELKKDFKDQQKQLKDEFKKYEDFKDQQKQLKKEFKEFLKKLKQNYNDSQKDNDNDEDKECKGVSSLTLEYSGIDIATIKVKESKNKPAFATFEVKSGESFTITPLNGKDKFKAKTIFEIVALKNDSKLIDRIEIHTSCSKPIDIGDVHARKIVSLEIMNLDKIFDDKKCKGVSKLSLQYSGTDIATIKVKESENKPAFATFEVKSGESFTITPLNGKDKLKATTIFEIFSSEQSNVIDVQISQNTDDAREKKDGEMDLDDKSHLHIGKDQTGLRFQDIEIPLGSAITKAYIQFTAEKNKAKESGVDIFAEDVDNAKTFSKTKFDITNRARTNASIDWFIPTWENKGDAGLAQRTPDISTLVQEIVDRDGWSGGNSIAFMLISNNKEDRHALTYDGDPLHGALLHIEFSSTQTTKEITLAEMLKFDTEIDAEIVGKAFEVTFTEELLFIDDLDSTQQQNFEVDLIGRPHRDIIP